MPSEIKSQYNHLLSNISKELDISPSKYQQAVERYNSVGKWLEEGVNESDSVPPKIYVQGSFRLGTVIRPIKNNEESDYDIDLVCELQNRKQKTTPKEIKVLVGDRLKENPNYNRMLDVEGRRCWTLNYSEQDGIGFHLDILPSIPEENESKLQVSSMNVSSNLVEKSISITHKDKNNNYSWNPSNPDGFADWFEEKNMSAFIKLEKTARRALFESNQTLYASIDHVPRQLIKTPLQRAIQILKRHRDLRFADHKREEDKPISMIITTLAAKLYQGEEDIFSTLKNIIENLYLHSVLLEPDTFFKKTIADQKLIEHKNGQWVIKNPVNPSENFADRWHENDNRKAKEFFKWISWVHSDLIEILNLADIKSIGESLEKHFGEPTLVKASKGLYVAGAPAIMEREKKPDYHVEIKEPIKPWATNEQY